MSLHLILFVIAAVCFLLATFNVKFGSANLVALGLLAWVLTHII